MLFFLGNGCSKHLIKRARQINFKMIIEPMNNPLGVGPSKRNQGTTRGKEKTFDLGGNRTDYIYRYSAD